MPGYAPGSVPPTGETETQTLAPTDSTESTQSTSAEVPAPTEPSA